ncbi:MAG: TetR family transcriptional regulator [Solirubrobacteraceae bacterium]
MSGVRRRGGSRGPVLGRRGPLARESIKEMQRRRMLTAAAEAIADVGWSGLTVAEIIRRARVSRKTFYEIFEGCEDCFLCTFEVAVSEVTLLAEDAYLRQGGWRDGVRAALTRLLVFFDEEPDRTRLLLVEASAAGEMVLARRAEILGELAGVIDAGREVKDASWPSLAMAEGVIGGVLAILQTRVQEPQQGPFVGLAPQLMSFIVLPYLGAAAAQRELRRPVASVRPGTLKRETHRREDPLAGLNMRLTYRTVQVLRSVRKHPGTTNRALAQACGIADQGQISKLVARLQRLGLMENHGEGHTKGSTNAWYLTERGTQLEQATQAY